jgi:antibiotic biosynthesis monooxygenase (ABM) superfamily enzyme
MSRSASDNPVTVLATRTVREGHQTEFETFLRQLQDPFAAAPGHLGLTVIRPHPPDRQYALVYRFDNQGSLLAWQRSPQRAEAIACSARLTESSPHERLLTGMETWFTAPTGGIVRPPPRWKMCLLSACGIYPLITLITVLAGPLLIRLPPPARFAIVTPVLSALMTWAIMPALTRLFAAFIYPHDVPRAPTHT